MLQRSIYILFLSIIVSVFGSCNDYEKVLKSDDVNFKFTNANQYFEKKQFAKANVLYEGLLPVMRGTKNFEPLYFKYSYSSYFLKDYTSASYHFKNFVDYFPGSKDADEAEFMHAVCLYKMAPKASLEQTNTIKAMEALQSYINTHPDSKKIVESNVMMDEMRRKLEVKEASAAKLYFDISQYKAATIAYKTIIQNYPESVNSDYYQLMIAKANYYFAKASVVEKQEERFMNTIDAIKEFKDNYSKSKYNQEADKYFLQANNYLKKLRNEHQ